MLEAVSAYSRDRLTGGIGTSLARTHSRREGDGAVWGLPRGVFLIDLWSPGAEVNATMIENDPVDEVQGFLFGKLK